MNDGVTKALKTSLYREIYAKIKGGLLYGQPIDSNNPEEIAIAFYFLGMKEAHDKYDADLRRVKFLERGGSMTLSPGAPAASGRE